MGELVALPVMPEPVPVPLSKLPDAPVPVLLPVSNVGLGVAVTCVVGTGRTGLVTSGHGDEATLPRSLISPQALSSRLSIKARTRYTKDLFIFILLLLFCSAIICGPERIMRKSAL